LGLRGSSTATMLSRKFFLVFGVLFVIFTCSKALYYPDLDEKFGQWHL